MAQYFYGSEALVEAIAASSQNVTYSIANAEIANAYAAAGLNGVKQLAADYGLNYVTYADKTTPAMWVLNSMQGATETSAEVLYPAVLDSSVDAVTNEVVYETAKQVTTQGGGRVFAAGAIKTATTALSVVGAVATGVQLGWESYKAHPDFWTDFSESMFNSNDPDTPIEVLARAHAGGYTTAVKEEKMCKLLQGLAATGCFDYREYTSLVEHTGVQPVTFTEVPALGKCSQLGYEYAQQHFTDPVVINCTQDTDRFGDTDIRCWMLVAERANLPTSAEIYSLEDYAGNTVYYAGVNSYQITVSYNLVTDSVNWINMGGGVNHYQVWSGKHQDDANSYSVGGLNCNIVTVEADNEMFTNDHTGNALSIAPTATISQIAQAIKDQFPTWYDDSWTQDEYNPETGTVDSNRYYPITIPWWDPTNETIKDPDYTPDAARRGDIKQEPDPKAAPQGKTATKNNPEYKTDPRLAPDVPVVPPTDTPSDPGAGAGGSASGLWAVYNPTIAELNDLGAYLWTNNIIELLQKFLQNPMDAIISLHRLYITPDTGAPQSIMLGYLNSGVTATVVTNQFKTLNCGNVVIPEYFEDARDYDAPYTIVECYLPFVGIVRLRTEDIIGGTVNIVYEVDVYSGACLAKIFVTKLGAKQLLYTYSGNCSMQIPLTGGDRTRLLSGALTGAVGGAVVGGPVGAVAGAIGGAFKGGVSIDRCGGFSANAGCMGIKKPYIIVTRKYSYDAGNYNQFYGFPSNVSVSLGSCRGYTRVKSVHIDSIPIATDTEKTEIETLLKQGVVIK